MSVATKCLLPSLPPSRGGKGSSPLHSHMGRAEGVARICIFLVKTLWHSDKNSSRTSTPWKLYLLLHVTVYLRSIYSQNNVCVYNALTTLHKSWATRLQCWRASYSIRQSVCLSIIKKMHSFSVLGITFCPGMNALCLEQKAKTLAIEASLHISVEL